MDTRLTNVGVTKTSSSRWSCRVILRLNKRRSSGTSPNIGVLRFASFQSSGNILSNTKVSPFSTPSPSAGGLLPLRKASDSPMDLTYGSIAIQIFLTKEAVTNSPLDTGLQTARATPR